MQESSGPKCGRRVWVRIREILVLCPYGKTKLYDILGANPDLAKKDGRLTLVNLPAFEARIATLPNYRPGGRRKRQP